VKVKRGLNSGFSQAASGLPVGPYPLGFEISMVLPSGRYP
jgi:hypothetical protein